jgi:hypothetical protein
VTVAALIKQAGADGLRLWADGEGLAYEGPADVVERWKPRIVASKPEIMAALTAPRLTYFPLFKGQKHAANLAPERVYSQKGDSPNG